MKEIFSTKSLRLLTLVEALRDRDLSLDQLCEVINVSYKTLKSDIEYVNQLIFPLCIKESYKKKYSLYIPSTHSFAWVYSVALKKSKEFQLLELIFLKENMSLIDLANELLVSQSSLQRIIKRINPVLKKEGFYIQRNTLNIVGNEMTIRNFYIHYFMEKFPDGGYDFDERYWAFCMKCLDEFFNKIHKTINYTSLEKFRIFLIVTLIRESHGHTTPDRSNPVDLKFSQIEIDWRLKRLAWDVFNIELTTEKFISLFSHFFSTKYAFNEDEFLVNVEKNGEVRCMKAVFEKLLKDISGELELPIYNLHELTRDLCNNFFLNYGRPFILYDFYAEFILFFKRQNPAFLHSFENKILLALKGFGIEQQHIDNYLYIIFTHWPELYSFTKKSEKKTRIGIFFNTDLEHTLFIKDMLECEYNSRFIFEIIDFKEIEDVLDQFLLYDCVVTNISLRGYKNTICFSTFPTNTELETLYKRLLEIEYQKIS